MESSILITGDLVPTESNMDLFIKGDINHLLGKDLVSIWKSANARIFNLEVPICNNGEPIPKCGPNLMSTINSMTVIKSFESFTYYTCK